MKKLVLTLLVLLVLATYAGVVDPFKQFTQADYHDVMRIHPDETWNEADQRWSYAQLISLSVSGGNGVWLSNYMSNWYGGAFEQDGGNVDLDGNTYNMSPKAYGYIFTKDIPTLYVEKPNYDNVIHWSNGATTDITYFSDEDNSITVTTTGYFLDYFEDDAEIYLVLTTLAADGGETVDSYQYVEDDSHETILQSRQHNTNDIAGNVRVNFGIDTPPAGDYQGIGREFVAVYSGDEDLIRSQLTGGPLPGVFFAGLLSLGTVLGASRMKRRKHA